MHPQHVSGGIEINRLADGSRERGFGWDAPIGSQRTGKGFVDDLVGFERSPEKFGGNGRDLSALRGDATDRNHSC